MSIRLLDKQSSEDKKMERSEQINELAKALSLAQGEIKPAVKDAVNPFFKSKYADLAAVWDACRGPLVKAGLAISQHPTTEGNVVTIETIVMHTSGQWMASKLSMTAKENTPQGLGGVISYARRYSLSSIMGISSEEELDGNVNGNGQAEAKPKPLAKPQDPRFSDPSQVPTSVPKGSLSEQTMKSLEKARESLGTDMFDGLLGGQGYKVIADIKTEEEAGKVVRLLREVYEESIIRKAQQIKKDESITDFKVAKAIVDGAK
jgi:hypothetical protein